MILVILQVTVPLMGILGVNAALFGKERLPDSKIKNGLLTALGVTGGISLLFVLFPSLAGDFASSSDAMFGGNTALVEALRDDRRSLLRADAFRSLIFIVLAAVVFFASWKGKLKAMPAVTLLGILLLVDLWGVDKRYLNKEHFVTERNFDSQFNPRPVDNAIHQDTDLSYRVLDLTVNTFNDAIVSYHHKTIGGYSPAKLQRYQDLIDFHIAPEMRTMIDDVNSAMSTARTVGDLENALGYYPVLSMLNTKYIVVDPGSLPLTYDRRLGNGWLVSRVRTAPTADAEMAALGEIDPAVEAVIFDPDAPEGTVTEYAGADSGRVELVYYSPNRLRYDVSAPAKGLAVFSEIWYPAGWKAFVDGNEVPVLRADYALRALMIEEGDHEVEFVFDPASFTVGRNISLASSIAILVLLAGAVLYSVLFADKRKHHITELLSDSCSEFPAVLWFLPADACVSLLPGRGVRSHGGGGGCDTGLLYSSRSGCPSVLRLSAGHICQEAAIPACILGLHTDIRRLYHHRYCADVHRPAHNTRLLFRDCHCGGQHHRHRHHALVTQG